MAATTSAPRRTRMDSVNGAISKIGRSVGGVVGALYQAGRDTIDMVIRNVLPFIALISFIIGVILKTGVGDWIANRLSGLADSLPGLLAIAIVCAIPVISPLLGPGAVIAQIVGTLLGVQIGRGEVPRSTRCTHCSPSTRRWAATSFPSAWPSARRSRRRWRSACRPCCSHG